MSFALFCLVHLALPPYLPLLRTPHHQDPPGPMHSNDLCPIFMLVQDQQVWPHAAASHLSMTTSSKDIPGAPPPGALRSRLDRSQDSVRNCHRQRRLTSIPMAVRQSDLLTPSMVTTVPRGTVPHQQHRSRAIDITMVALRSRARSCTRDPTMVIAATSAR
jgi:hypothetical protein